MPDSAAYSEGLEENAQASANLIFLEPKNE